MIRHAPLAILLLALPACRIARLPDSPPPLRMEEPIELKIEPDDEAVRVKLPLGSFSGAVVRSAFFEEPDDPSQRPDALEIVKIVENSPADAAGLVVGDLLLSVRRGDADTELRYPSQWHKLESDCEPGSILSVKFDRAGEQRQTKIMLIARVRPAGREPVERFREEKRAGIVLRTATEVEARAVGLGAGGGAVLIGMSANSPWRGAGLKFGDLVVAAGGQSVDHPQVLLGAIRSAQGAVLPVTYHRGSSEATQVDIPLTRRRSALSSVSIPLLFSYDSHGDSTEWSILFGFLGYESTTAAWEFGFLWLFSFGGGDIDQLEEVRK